jgi:NitT/TauT family transport system ATP-binding protein
MEIALSHVTHRFGDLTALDDVSLHAHEGEIVAIIGPSGCGKSTLLGIAGGILRPTAGEVVLRGVAAADTLNEITFIFQDFSLLPWLSVRDNVAFVLKHHKLGAAEIERRIANALERTGLSDFAAALPKQLSGGMRQRVGIARALAVRPAVFLMDEPLSALDAQTRELLLDDILALWERDHPTILYVTHNFQEAIRIADRVCVLSRRPGRVREIIEIPSPRAQRALPARQAEVAELGARLWSLIKEEAIGADRELVAHV